MKILSNKKYNELILKSCKGMFGAVTDDMLLRDNALLNEEVKELKEVIDKARDCSQIYEDSLGHTRLVNEDIFDEVNNVLQKYKEMVGVSDENNT